MITRRLLGAVALVACAASVTQAQSYRTVTDSRRHNGERDFRVEVEFGIGRIEIGPSNGRDLYRLAMVYDEDRFEPELRYRESRNALHAGVSSFRNVNVNYKDGTEQRLDLALSRSVPVALDLAFGAVRADIELGGLLLTNARIKTGASRTDLRFSEPNRAVCESLRIEIGAAEFVAQNLGNARCQTIRLEGGAGDWTLDFGGEWSDQVATRLVVKMGLAGLKLRLPENVGVRLDIDRFLVSMDRSGFSKRGSDYFSRNYDSARIHLDIEIDAALGNIEVDWIR
ncbi:MAG TPA: toast rack family protein [Gemmatimonadales bacterium]